MPYEQLLAFDIPTMNPSMPNKLNLSRYNILGTSETDHDLHIDAETASPPKSCLECGSDNVVGGGRQKILIKDIPMYEKRVGIYVKTRRNRCLDCGKTLTERLPDVAENQRMTTRLYRWIAERSIDKTFISIAHDVGVSEGTVRKIFNEYTTELARTLIFETPEWMGIDEIHIIGKPRGVITNIESNTVVYLLTDRTKALITNYFMKLSNRKSIKCVAMDMWAPYRDAVYSTLPQAFVVVDKFHVVKMANSALEVIRKSIRSELTTKQVRGLMHDRSILLKREDKLEPFQRLTLESWTRNFPALGEAYRAKENFFAIYDAMTIPEAKAAYYNWNRSLSPAIKGAFKPVVTAMGNWETEIFNYFDHPITNAYTECLNGLIRVIECSGRGYSFEALRSKILYTAGAHKKVKPKFERRGTSANEFCRMTAFSTGSTIQTQQEKNFGTDISTLLRIMTPP